MKYKNNKESQPIMLLNNIDMKRKEMKEKSKDIMEGSMDNVKEIIDKYNMQGKKQAQINEKKMKLYNLICKHSKLIREKLEKIKAT